MPIPEVMKGVQLTGHGGPEKLFWNEAIPTPRPGQDEVLIKVLAAGVNNTDVNTRIGWYSKEINGSTDDALDSALSTPADGQASFTFRGFKAATCAVRWLGWART